MKPKATTTAPTVNGLRKAELMKKLSHVFPVLVVVALLVPAAMFGQAPPPFEPPQPSGRWPIGTTTWVVTDTGRPDPFAPGLQRQVRVVAWYPSVNAKDASLAPYLRQGPQEVRAFATLLRAPGAFEGLPKVFGHGMVDADPAKQTKLPVLLFSHGYTAVPSSYTLLMEDLASHGYVVLSIVHPYEATAATLADGSVVTMLDEQGQLRQGIRRVLDEWGAEDATLAKVTATDDDADQVTLLRGYLAGLKNTEVALRRWVDDTRLVLDRLKALPASTPPGRLAAKIDLTRLGAFGHSMGGVTAGQFCLEETRCRAALNLDGSPQYGTMIDKVMGKPLLMVYSDRPGREGASDAIYRASASTYYRVDVHQTLHVDFSDMGFWGGPLRERGAFGPIAPDAAANITRRIVREFFDQELLGRTSPLLNARTKWSWEQVAVQVKRPLKK